MARAIEKGATYLDKLCHKFYDEPKGCGKKTDYVCRLCGGPLETYYCEERLYLVKCADCGTLALVKTANPEDSARVTLARPTLTPPNEPLTEGQLLKMKGQPVWVRSSRRKEWMLLWGFHGPEIYGRSFIFTRRTAQKEQFQFSELGVTWWPYRCPPEGEDDEKTSD